MVDPYKCSHCAGQLVIENLSWVGRRQVGGRPLELHPYISCILEPTRLDSRALSLGWARFDFSVYVFLPLHSGVTGFAAGYIGTENTLAPLATAGSKLGA